MKNIICSIKFINFDKTLSSPAVSRGHVDIICLIGSFLESDACVFFPVTHGLVNISFHTICTGNTLIKSIGMISLTNDI